MAVSLSPFAGAGWQFFSDDGVPLAGGKLYTYAAGSTSSLATYTSKSGSTANTNPIILNAAGRVANEIWLTVGLNYKFILKNSNDVLIGTYDNIPSVAAQSGDINIAYTQQVFDVTASTINPTTGVQTVFDITSTYTPGNNGIAVYLNGSRLNSGTDFTETDSNTITLIYGANVGDVLLVVTAEYINTINAVSAANVTYLPAGTGAVSTTVQTKLRETVSVKDFGAVGDGVTSDTQAIKNAFDAVAANNAHELLFPAGTYLLTNPNSDAAFTAAIVISGLKKCVVRGEKGTKFIVSTGGIGTSEFAFFRIEQCEDVEFCNFEMDGSGIVITGSGANRSNGFFAVNFNVNSASTDLATSNKRLEFHHIYAHDMGGFITCAKRSDSLAVTPVTYGLSVHDCQVENLLGVDHGVSCSSVWNVQIRNNRFINNISSVTLNPLGNMAVDISSYSRTAIVENNYVYGFSFGMKSETHINAGPSGTEKRPSRDVLFINNVLEEIGFPDILVVPGPSGGDTYGLKINSTHARAIGNRVSPRTVNVTTGGLQISYVVQNTSGEVSHIVLNDNYAYGSNYGVVHNDDFPSNRTFTCVIRDNRFDSQGLYGILLQENCIVDNNTILQAGRSAIYCQTPNNSIVKNNYAYNCASTNNAVISAKVVYMQDPAGAYSGFMEWTDNKIVDTRGASAAEYGYFLYAGGTQANTLLFSPGYANGLLTGIAYDQYFSDLGVTYQVNNVTIQSPRTVYTTNSPAIIAPWNAMTWRVGDRAILGTPTVGSAKAWVCTVAGTPGTWVSEGNL